MELGYAAASLKGKIDIHTVGPTERSAMVNWLWRTGVKVTNDWDDQMIVTGFNALKALHQVEIIRVQVTGAT